MATAGLTCELLVKVLTQDVIAHPRAGRGKEPGVDALETLPPALPDKGRATAV